MWKCRVPLGSSAVFVGLLQGCSKATPDFHRSQNQPSLLVSLVQKQAFLHPKGRASRFQAHRREDRIRTSSWADPVTRWFAVEAALDERFEEVRLAVRLSSPFNSILLVLEP
ncbi:hypothetical protein B0T13DRAFT_62811 [Neurospora crassa]|nr:hypothetical protein B0T13DRAFT_62811 [Neurospora crassa]